MKFNKYILVILLLLLFLFFKEGNMSIKEKPNAETWMPPIPKWISGIRNRLWGGNSKKATSDLANFDNAEEKGTHQKKNVMENKGEHTGNGDE